MVDAPAEPAPVGSPPKPSLWKRVIPTREKAQTVALPALPTLTIQEFTDFLHGTHHSDTRTTAIQIPSPLDSMPWFYGDLPRDSTYRLCRILTDGLTLDAGDLWTERGDAYKNMFQKEVRQLLLARAVLADSANGRPPRRQIESTPLVNFAQAFVDAEQALLSARQTDQQYEETRHDCEEYLAAYAQRLLKENLELLKRIRANMRNVGEWAGQDEGVAWRHAANDVESKLYTTESKEENVWVRIMKGQLHLELLTQVDRRVEAVVKFDPNAPHVGELRKERRAWLKRNAQREYSRATASGTAERVSSTSHGIFE